MKPNSIDKMCHQQNGHHAYWITTSTGTKWEGFSCNLMFLFNRPRPPLCTTSCKLGTNRILNKSKFGPCPCEPCCARTPLLSSISSCSSFFNSVQNWSQNDFSQRKKNKVSRGFAHKNELKIKNSVKRDELKIDAVKKCGPPRLVLQFPKTQAANTMQKLKILFEQSTGPTWCKS